MYINSIGLFLLGLAWYDHISDNHCSIIVLLSEARMYTNPSTRTRFKDDICCLSFSLTLPFLILSLGGPKIEKFGLQ